MEQMVVEVRLHTMHLLKIQWVIYQQLRVQVIRYINHVQIRLPVKQTHQEVVVQHVVMELKQLPIIGKMHI